MGRKSTRHTKATPELEKMIVEESIKGTTVEKMRCMFNASRILVIDIQKKNHVTKKDRYEQNRASRNRKIIELYESGERMTHIATQLGCSYPTVTKVLNECGSKKSDDKRAKAIDIIEEKKMMQDDSNRSLDKPISKYLFFDRVPEDIPKIKALHKAGWSIEKIADEMHSNPEIISNILKGDTQ